MKNYFCKQFFNGIINEYIGEKYKKSTLKKYIFLKKRETLHNKKFIHMKKPSQQAGGYRIGFLQFSSIYISNGGTLERKYDSVKNSEYSYQWWYTGIIKLC